MRQIDQVVEEKVLPYDIHAKNPTEEKTQELRQPCSTHDNEEFDDDTNLIPAFPMMLVQPSATFPCLIQIANGEDEKDNVCTLHNYQMKVKKYETSKRLFEEAISEAKTWPETVI